MTNYEILLDEAIKDDILVMNKVFKSNVKGLIKNNHIGINSKITTQNEKACVLAEELGHYYTSAGNIIDYHDTNNLRQEHIARLWSYNRLIGLTGIIEAFEYGCRTLFDISAYLGVTEAFLSEAIDAYRKKYGMYRSIGDHIIYFEPRLSIVRLF